ncbi:XRE family transcriptional regulator [Rhodovulum sulfidophilum]|uniref:Cupin domain-containing protein n=1 Tax=Rhodovulum visakhapatnamense TaxID=364297 RepID=A0A4R8G140_9RHOB|nr:MULTISPECIES: cupin domain-containing protein [Rhodovulum]MBL3569959.1 cupin domain-containing protein [Rhodovulum visakhapatnamense]MBL3577431.1 cupin domain-containing protein [Rhodovulum visakhapatnamense]OLS43418.1 XRE family transcriptional regulator [Rhodovulum sulfidophilum]TDX33289.1 XRE family transcriptional regulator [Rhodovulum visakhapatnamense]
MTRSDPNLPDTDPAGTVEADLSLGQAVRRARQGRDMSLKQVADGAGISVGLMSQIERGISSPSIRVLRAICGVLDIPVLSLFVWDDRPSEREARMIVRADRRRSVDFGDRGMVKSFLTAHDSGALQVMDIVLQPGGGSGEDAYRHVGEECGLVLVGSLEIWIDGHAFHLNEGDSFHFESVLPHKFRNLSDGRTRVLWITTPPVW